MAPVINKMEEYEVEGLGDEAPLLIISNGQIHQGTKVYLNGSEIQGGILRIEIVMDAQLPEVKATITLPHSRKVGVTALHMALQLSQCQLEEEED